MKLTTIEKKQFISIKKKLSDLIVENTMDRYDEFYREDIEERIDDINALIDLLNQEKSMLDDLMTK